MTRKNFNFKNIWPLLKETYREWNAGDPYMQSAAVSYYAIFSLPALLIIVITVAGVAFGQEAVQGKVSEQVGSLVGREAAINVESMIAQTKRTGNSTIATIVGVGTLLFGATGLFFQLQKSLNAIWDVKQKPDAGIKKVVVDRATSLGIVIAIGFLLLISLVITTLISAMSDWISSQLPDIFVQVFYVVNLIVSFAIIMVLFAVIYKVLPDVEISWKAVWTGAAVTALLFVIGKFALGIYFGKADPGSAFGAAGSIILILLWVSYSALILFFGAEFTQVYARHHGYKIVPSSHAERTAEFKLKHPDELEIKVKKQ